MAQATGQPTPDPYPVTILPFVRNGDLRDPQAHPFWNVTPTGDYAQDCLMGFTMGLQAIAYIRASGFTPVLGWTVSDMAKTGEWTGIEYGFFQCIAEALRGCQ